MAAFEVLYYLSGFNNYYNRTIKLAEAENISAYEQWILKYDEQVSFNPNDNVATSHVVNYVIKNGAEAPTLIPDETDIDYVILTDKDNNIISRWFVIDRKRNLVGQWQLDLRRDLIADYYKEIAVSPLFVEKGIINSAASRFIYNNENMQFNQVKKLEVLLKDRSRTPWVVGYISNDYNKITTDQLTGGKLSFGSTFERQASYEYSYSEINSLGTIITNEKNATLEAVITLNGVTFYKLRQGRDTVEYYYSPNSYNVTASYEPSVFLNEIAPNFINLRRFSEDYSPDLAAYINGYKSAQYVENLKKMSGALIKNTDETGPEFFYFNLEILPGSETTIIPPKGSTLYNQIGEYITRYWKRLNYGINFVPENENGLSLTYETQQYSVFVQQSPPAANFEVDLWGPTDGGIVKKTALKDAPYTLFCAPWNDIGMIDLGQTEEIALTGSVNQTAAFEIAKNLGESCYDLQLLPYCPFPNVINQQGKIDLNLWENFSTTSYAKIKVSGSDDVVGALFFPAVSSFHNYIDISAEIEEYGSAPSDPFEFKIKNETEMCRIVSPNYSGAFEFTPMKNNGFSAVEVNATYKPWQPLVQVSPVFNPGSLYGKDYNDNRGLICGGSFQLPTIADRWIQYQISNKSYKESFNRQIENMEVNNAVQREREIWQVAAGSVAGTAGGAMLGAKAGPYGAIAGAVVGGGAAIAGGIRDIQLAERLRSEALDYTKDQFGYNLQNIQALPVTMSQTSAFDVINKLYPFLEFYSCSKEEKEALRKKMIYNGMTVMSIAKLQDYMSQEEIRDGEAVVGSYIKAQLVRLAGSAEFHEANEIANELNKGVFFINEYPELD